MKKETPIAYKSDITDKIYPMSGYGNGEKEYVNHGYEGLKKGLWDLPKDEYPYSYVYQINEKTNN